MGTVCVSCSTATIRISPRYEFSLYVGRCLLYVYIVNCVTPLRLYSALLGSCIDILRMSGCIVNGQWKGSSHILGSSCLQSTFWLRPRHLTENGGVHANVHGLYSIEKIYNIYLFYGIYLLHEIYWLMLIISSYCYFVDHKKISTKM